MNETIGAKGGHNDKKRSLMIKDNQKKRLLAEREEREEKEIKEIEKRVKKQQIFTLIKILPITVVGQTIKTLYDTSIKDNSKRSVTESCKNDIITNNKPQKKQVIVLDEKRKKHVSNILITINNDFIKKKEEEIIKNNEEDVKEEENKKDEKEINNSYEEENKKPLENDINEQKEDEFFKEDKTNTSKELKLDETYPEQKNVVKEVKQDFIPIPSSFINEEISNLNKESLSEEEFLKLNKLKSRKIIDSYEKQLKDIRYDLRNLIYEYNVLVDDADDAKFSEETLVILDKLSIVINKIEELKRKIEIENLDKYDDNYIYSLVEEYLEEFKDKKVVEEIKDSPLYILISQKLEELDFRKDNLQRDVESKKENLQIKEEEFEKLKEKYFSIEKVNRKLLEVQYEQDLILKEVIEKVKNALTIEEKVRVEVQAMNKQSKKIFRLLQMQMLIPGFRSGRSMATVAATYFYFLNQILNPKTTTTKYRVIKVKDYSQDIKNNITYINDAKNLLGKTVNQIDKVILEINDKFKDYLGVLKEADDLLFNLEKIKSELKEKEEEMDRIKESQELALKENNAKVLKRGEYPM